MHFFLLKNYRKFIIMIILTHAEKKSRDFTNFVNYI